MKFFKTMIGLKQKYKWNLWLKIKDTSQLNYFLAVVTVSRSTIGGVVLIIFKNKESPLILFRVLLVTQNHVSKLIFLSPNLKIGFFGPRIKIIRDSKVWEYDYVGDHNACLKTVPNLTMWYLLILKIIILINILN